MNAEDTTPPAPTKAPMPRSDLTAMVVSVVVGALALLGYLPAGISTDDALAIGCALLAVAALVRGLWEQRKTLTLTRARHDAVMAAELFRERLAQVRARQAFDQAKLASVAELAHKAADPKDPTTLTPEGLLETLKAVDPDADTAPIDTPPPPAAA